MEEFLGRPLQRINPNTRVIQAAEKVPPLLARPLERRLSSRQAQSKHDHQQPQSVNGHAWVSPQAAIQMVETIAQSLAKLDPFHTALYQENARRYSHKLTGLLEEMRAVIKQSRNPMVITFHDVFDYLARDTGLKVAGVIQPQLGVEPAPRDMVHLVKMIRSQKVAAIFSEPQVSDRIAKALSRETGVPCYALDPVATGKPLAETYETAMKQNISVLRSALK